MIVHDAHPDEMCYITNVIALMTLKSTMTDL